MKRVFAVLGLLAMFAGGARGNAQAKVTIVEVTPADAHSRVTFGNVFGVAPLAGGRVLVNDGIRRQLVILDSKFETPTVLVDSLGTNGVMYVFRAVPLVPFLADSILFPDIHGRVLQVISPDGKLVRVSAPPKASDLNYILSSPASTDGRSNLFYRGQAPFQRVVMSDGKMQILSPVDSAPVLRASFDTRLVDTVGRIKTVPPEMQVSSGKQDEGLHMMVNPVIAFDEWAVTTDGSIAMVRGGDYHIDWISPTGEHFSSAKLPFDWKRITDEEKRALMDSARLAIAKEDSISIAAFKPHTITGGGRARSDGSVEAPAAPMVVQATKAPVPRVVEFVPLDQIADYYPAIRTGAVKADLDNNLWILPTTSAQSKHGELVYDVVSNKGVLVKRVRMPVGRSIAGFGKNGVLYLMGKEANGEWFVERTKVRSVVP